LKDGRSPELGGSFVCPSTANRQGNERKEKDKRPCLFARPVFGAEREGEAGRHDFHDHGGVVRREAPRPLGGPRRLPELGRTALLPVLRVPRHGQGRPRRRRAADTEVQVLREEVPAADGDRARLLEDPAHGVGRVSDPPLPAPERLRVLAGQQKRPFHGHLLDEEGVQGPRGLPGRDDARARRLPGRDVPQREALARRQEGRQEAEGPVQEQDLRHVRDGRGPHRPDPGRHREALRRKDRPGPRDAHLPRVRSRRRRGEEPLRAGGASGPGKAFPPHLGDEGDGRPPQPPGADKQGPPLLQEIHAVARRLRKGGREGLVQPLLLRLEPRGRPRDMREGLPGHGCPLQKRDEIQADDAEKALGWLRSHPSFAKLDF
jgi:hypothetical protein